MFRLMSDRLMSGFGSNCEIIGKMCVINQHEYGAVERDQRLRVLNSRK